MKVKEILTILIKTQEVTDDCCGKWDLDFPILKASTRGWRDNTAKCSFIIDDDISWDDENTILESGYLKAKTREELILKCRKWYLRNLKKAIKLLGEKLK